MDDATFSRHTLEIRLLTALIAQVARRDIEKRLRFEDQPISLSGFIILRILGSTPMTINGLSDLMLVTPATLVTLIDTLEKKGLVRRGKDAEDRRKNPIMLTPKGEQVLKYIPVTTEGDTFTEALAHLSDEQQTQLMTILRALLENMIGGDKVQKLEEVIHGYD